MKVFISYALGDKELVSIVETILRDEGHEILYPMDMVATLPVFSQITAAIRSTNLFISFLNTGNPSALLELGLALGANVPTLIVSATGELIPSDLAAIPYIQLVGDKIRDAQTVARRVTELWKQSQAFQAKLHTKYSVNNLVCNLFKSDEGDFKENSNLWLSFDSIHYNKIFSSPEMILIKAVREPAFLESISPINFEQMIMELFRERGYKVKVNKETMDIRVDFSIESLEGQKTILVEVKKLSKHSRVSIETVRKLLSAVSALGASLGMIVSTSPFTAASIAFAAGVPIVLRNLEEILAAKSENDLLEINMNKR